MAPKDSDSRQANPINSVGMNPPCANAKFRRHEGVVPGSSAQGGAQVDSSPAPNLQRTVTRREDQAVACGTEVPPTCTQWPGLTRGVSRQPNGPRRSQRGLPFLMSPSVAPAGPRASTISLFIPCPSLLPALHRACRSVLSLFSTHSFSIYEEISPSLLVFRLVQSRSSLYLLFPCFCSSVPFYLLLASPFT